MELFKPQNNILVINQVLEKYKLLYNFKKWEKLPPRSSACYNEWMRRTRITFEPIDLSVMENHYLLTWLDAQCFPDDTPAIIPGAEWWIGRNPLGVSAAYCAYRVRYESRTPVAELYRAGVMPGFRGQGLQRRMIDLRCKAAKKQNLKTAMTVTAWNNAASMRSLMSAGFKPHRPNAYTTILETLVHWRKEL